MFLSMISCVIACHYLREATCHQHGCWSSAACAVAYATYAVIHALTH